MTFALLAGGAWGLVAPREDAVGVGDAVELDGGRATVVAARALDDPMMMMHESHDGFADAGMAMPNMIPDAAPDGMQRIVVEVLFEAGDSVMRFPAEQISLESDGVRHRAYSALLADQQLGPGASLHGVLTFEIPDDISAAALRLGDGSTPVAFHFEPGASHEHPDGDPDH